MNYLIAGLNGVWPAILIPIVIFGASLILLLWLRTKAFVALEKFTNQSSWQGNKILFQAIKRPSIYWCVIVSVLLGSMITDISSYWKSLIGKGLWSVFILTFTFFLISVTTGFTSFYSAQLRKHSKVFRTVRNIIVAIIIIITVLTLLDTWGISTTYLLLSILIAVIILALVFRDFVPNIVASFQINAASQMKVGDYIRLESGEEGYIIEMNWRNTRLRTLQDSTIIIPNSRLVRSTITNYGHPLKKATAPFHFIDRLHLTQLTGLKAKNLQELVEILSKAPDDIVYYHTHHFLEEQYYTTPQLSNDFAVWVDSSLGNDVLAERLASIDPFDFTSIGSLRERLVSVIVEYLATTASTREAAEGREFYFMKAVSVIFPTSYIVHDLREFTEALRKISLDSLYFHIFESKLRLGKGLNDFTVWMKDSLGEPDLADEIARIDPYTYTLEGLRSSLIQRIEKHIK